MLKVTEGPNRNLILRSDPWPPADEHFLLLDTPCSLLRLLGGLAPTWSLAGHRYGVGHSGRFTQAGAGAFLSLRHRALCCSGGTTLVNHPHLLPRASALLQGHSLPCKMPELLFFCLVWLKPTSEGALERGRPFKAGARRCTRPSFRVNQLVCTTSKMLDQSMLARKLTKGFLLRLLKGF